MSLALPPIPTSPSALRPLRAQALCIIRGDRSVIQDLSFEVMPGDILQVKGPNGAGKTSLFETLVGLRSPDRGHIDGQPDRCDLHWIGHKNALNPALSVLQNLRFWANLNQAGGADLEAALQDMGLKASQLHRPCAALSTGQRRRAALSRLRIIRRPWWILDEPLAGLDAQGIGLIAQMMAEHSDQGGAVVVSSHQPLPLDAPRLKSLALIAAARGPGP